jgi:hypothetical protein
MALTQRGAYLLVCTFGVETEAPSRKRNKLTFNRLFLCTGRKVKRLLWPARRPKLRWLREAAGMTFLDGDTAQQLIGHHGYAAVFLVVMLESAGIPRS